MPHRSPMPQFFVGAQLRGRATSVVHPAASIQGVGMQRNLGAGFREEAAALVRNQMFEMRSHAVDCLFVRPNATVTFRAAHIVFAPDP